ISTATYDAAGNQLTAADNAGAYTMLYDALGHVTQVAEPQGMVLTCTYDTAGNRTVVESSGNGAILQPTLETSTYNSANELTERSMDAITWDDQWEAELQIN